MANAKEPKLEYHAGSMLHTQADSVEHLELVTSGKVEIISDDFHITAERGAILGLFEFPKENYNYTYIAKETCTLDAYPFRRKSDIDAIVRARSDECDVLVSANAALALSLLGHYKRKLRKADTLRRCIQEGYADYRRLCKAGGFEIQPWPFAEDLEKFTPERELPDWLGDYYDQLGMMPSDIKKRFYSVHSSLTTAAILESMSHIQLIRRLFDQLKEYVAELKEQYLSGADLFDLYANLMQHCAGRSDMINDIRDKLAEYHAGLSRSELLPAAVLDKYRGLSNMEAQSAAAVSSAAEAAAAFTAAKETAEEDPLTKLKRSLDQILAYTQLDEAEEERFRGHLEAYKALTDKNSAENEHRRLRSDLAKGFFDVYESAVLQAMEDTRKPPLAVRLFLYFGYMDEDLAGWDNTRQLLTLLARVEEDDDEAAKHIYTIYEWLSAIYRGAKEPSKNEFDQDYPAWLKSRRQSGEITEEMEKRFLKSPRERMRFELDNFFHLGMRIASGRPSVFCPVLSSHNIIRSLEQTYVSAAAVGKNWDEIKKTDYALFFREALYQNPDYKLPRESILMEVLPDVILLPMVGSRGGLWQEIAGVHRDTPARMYLPIFSSEDLALTQLRMAAQFRWQICRRVQGARWNDVSDPSLTAEYCDYLQFYRKNNELSSDAKEKVKAEILSCKNSYENVFVLDYIQWIRFEAQGSPRLTRVAKRILFTYCPFSAAVRGQLENNPMYADLIRRHEVKAARQQKLLTIKYDKTKKEFGSLPVTIENYLKYFSS